ncbi:MAG: DUF1501 domain-containing protein [Planctomycetota bacterium]|nr:DUF1501 domain-containing protein [Planctomycetota bacterium]
MLHLGNASVPDCSGLNRRSFLQAGSTGLAGLTLPNLMRLDEAGAFDDSKAKIKNCITLFLVGSPGHLDTWDLKPDAPSDIRGKFKPISTNVADIRICEHFPLMARMMDKVSLIRSLHHETGTAHSNGSRWMMTGKDAIGDNQQPHVGSVVARVFGPKTNLPPNVILPAKIGNTGGPSINGQEARYLGSAYEPFFLGADPARSNFEVSNLKPAAGQTEFRINARRNLLRQIDDIQRRSANSTTVQRDTAYARAFNLLTSPEAKASFDLEKESDKTRDRYGRNTLGQSCLMARRLVERGTRYVTVNHFDTVFNIACWDMHANGSSLNNTYLDYEQLLCPQLDQAFTALVDDLDQRGLLQETVIAVLSEFGRTPKLNARGGRDHYPPAWSNFLCGGNIRGGQVIGSTDKIGAAPHERPVKPPQVIASIYQGMGIDLETTMMPGPGSRPIRLIDAEPIPELF